VPISLLGGSIAAQQPSGGAEPVRPSPISQAELVKRLTTSLDSLAKAGQFSGVAVVAKNGVPVFQRAYGMADRERGVANNPETTFNLGSINKIFTQIAILQLRAAGKEEKRYPHSQGLSPALCESAAGVRAGDTERLLECGIRRARPRDRAAVGG